MGHVLQIYKIFQARLATVGSKRFQWWKHLSQQWWLCRSSDSEPWDTNNKWCILMHFEDPGHVNAVDILVSKHRQWYQKISKNQITTNYNTWSSLDFGFSAACRDLVQVASYSAGYSDRAGGIVPVHLCSNFASAADVFLETKWIGAQIAATSRTRAWWVAKSTAITLRSTIGLFEKQLCYEVMNSTRFCNILELCLMPRGLHDPQKCWQIQPDHHQPLESSDLLNET